MIRETLNPGSADAFAYFQPNQALLQYRPTTGASVAYQSTGYSAAQYPYWVQLVRAGNTFTGYVSSDGVNWTQAGASTTITMAPTVYIDLALTAQGHLETTTFP